MEVTDVFTKIKDWLQDHHLGWVVIIFAALAGFLVGRRSNGAAAADFAKLREDYAGLTERLRQREAELDQLRELHHIDAERYSVLTAELSEARTALDGIGKSVESGQGNVGKLAENNRRLAEWIRNYGTQIEVDESEG